MAGTRLLVQSLYLLGLVLALPLAWLALRAEVPRAPLPSHEAVTIAAQDARRAAVAPRIRVGVVSTGGADGGALLGARDRFVELARSRGHRAEGWRGEVPEAARDAGDLETLDRLLNDAARGGGSGLLPNELLLLLIGGGHRLSDGEGGAATTFGTGRVAWAFAPASTLTDDGLGRLLGDLEAVYLRPPWPASAPASSLEMVFTLAVAAPEGRGPAPTWSVGALLEAFPSLARLVGLCGDLYDLDFSSDVVYHARLPADGPLEGGAFRVNLERLAGGAAGLRPFGDAAVGPDAHGDTWRLVFYVPPADETPTFAAAPASAPQAFAVDGYGAFTVVNGARGALEGPPGLLRPADFRDAASGAACLLRGLLQLPWACAAQDGGGLLSWEGVRFRPARREGVAAWEADLLRRRATAVHLQAAARALENAVAGARRSLQIPVSADAAGRAFNALALLRTAAVEVQAEAEAGGVEGVAGVAGLAGVAGGALRAARLARREAEAFLYDPSVVTWEVFDWEALYAIHAPLAVPLVLPLLIGWVGELRRYRRKESAAAERAAAKKEA